MKRFTQVLLAGWRKSSMKLALVMVVALSVVPAASGAVILTAYPQASSGAFTLNGSPPINIAGGFTTATTPFVLTSAKVQFSAVGVAQFSTSQIAADLYGGTGGPTGEPSGAPLISFVIPAGTISGNATDVTMTPGSPFTLQASTSYWLVLHADSSVVGNLAVNSAPNPATGSFATYVGMTQDGSLPPQGRNGANLLFEIDGRSVPEPSAICSLALGSTLLMLRCRRQC
jgi:hypothetical protein